MPPPVFQRDQLIDIEEDVEAVDGMTVATGTYRIVRVGSDLDHVYVVRSEHTDGPEFTIRQEDLLEVTPLFTCQTCRSHEIEISHAYTSVQDFVKTLPCTCEEESGNDFAAERRFTVSTDVQNWGAVTEDHRTEWDATTQNDASAATAMIPMIAHPTANTTTA